MLRKIPTVVHAEARQELFPGVLTKKTACDVRNSLLHYSIIEGTRVSFVGLFPIICSVSKPFVEVGKEGEGELGNMIWQKSPALH